MPTYVKGSIDKSGTVRPGHMSTRKKKIATPTKPEHVESTLDTFITSHGGAEHLRTSLNEMTPEHRAKLIDAMAYVGGIDHAAVIEKLAMRDPAQERSKLVERLGRGVTGGYIDEADSGVVLESFDKDGSQAALDVLRGILKQKKEALAAVVPVAAAEPVVDVVPTVPPTVAEEVQQTADETVAPASPPPLNRLRDDPDLRSGLQAMKAETGWAQVGGKLMRDATTDAVTGRTTWIPNSEWWPGRPKGLKEAEVHAAVDKALAGQPMKKRERAMVDFMTQVHDERLAMQATHAELKEAVTDLAEQPHEAVDITVLTSRAGDYDPEATAAVLDGWDDDEPETITRIRGELEQIIGNGQKTLIPEAAGDLEPAEAQRTSAVALDLFGEDRSKEQALADETRRRDEARSPNKEVSVETGDPGDLFSQSRQQLDLTSPIAATVVDIGPQEGATKTENGIDYVLRDGRWHRVTTEVAEVATVAEQDPQAPAEPETEPDVAVEPESAIADGDDMDPNSPNYRYRDTGYVGGSRKEAAAMMIRRAAKSGERVRATDIDWDEIEKNPREAAELITKKNIFGDIDWATMSQTGMEPGAGFLLQKVYAAVGADPMVDSALGRHDYAVGIESVRNRLEACKTVEDVSNTLSEIQDERDGIILTDEEQSKYETYSAAAKQEWEAVRKVEAEADRLYQLHLTASQAASKLKFDIEKRGIRKWKVDPEMTQQLADATAEAARVMDTWRKYREDQGMQPITHQTKDARGISSRFEYPYKKKYEEASALRSFMRSAIQERNLRENPLTRAWNALGESFNAVINYRRHKGSEAFGRHMATAKAGRVKDWEWAEKKGGEPRKASKRSTSFQLRVADNFEREGGRTIPVDSTASLKGHFGLREIQSGNWVLDDPNSAKFHVEHCANAFADMADLLGIPDKQASFNGRLAMAFGARGRGNAGGSAAQAHYEPVERVINLTKMAGGGSLAHEWFHFVDNIVKEATTGVGSSVDDFATENAGMLDDPDLKAAFSGLSTAMMAGPHRKTAVIQYTETEEKFAHHNMQQTRFGGTIRDTIRSASGVQDALDKVESMYARGAFGGVEKKKAKSTRDTWRKIAAIHHAGNAQREIRYETGAGMSMFALEAMHLDQGVSGKYWSSPREMAARAFSSFMQDKLDTAQRKNTYLVSMADNEAYKAMGEPHRPFPEGAERAQVNAAFEKLFTVLRDREVLAKALALFDG